MRNLKIGELSVGSWVRRVSGGGFSRPLKVTGVKDDGTMCLSDGSDVFIAGIGSVLPVQMDEDVMRGFGFVRVAKGDNVWMRSVLDLRLTVSLRMRHGAVECRRAAISGRFACWNEEIRYIHELQRWWVDKVLLPYGVELVLEWDGDVTEREEL